jgi:hypothetical protein
MSADDILNETQSAGVGFDLQQCRKTLTIAGRRLGARHLLEDSFSVLMIS